MFRRVVGTALAAGMSVGVLLAALQHVALVPLIHEAERYERHGGPGSAAALHPLPALVAAADAHEAATPGSSAGEAPADPPMRAVLTTVATVLTAIGFAFMLAGAFAVSGRAVEAREGVLWGLAGCAIFALAPAFGLPPELPGSVAAELFARQAWWVGTAMATAAGLGLLAFGRARWAAPVALAALALPHVIGAPRVVDGAGTVPPELAAAFAARVLVVGAVFWAALGWTSGALYARFGRVV